MSKHGIIDMQFPHNCSITAKILEYFLFQYLLQLTTNPIHLNNLCVSLSVVGLYGISTVVGYLMPNPVFTYIFMICKHFVVTFSNKPELISFAHS